MSDITIPLWQPAPPDWTFAEGEVVIFRLDLSGIPTAQDQSVLSADERSRAQQFRFDEHRNRWIICRAALRRLLGRSAHSPPAKIPIVYNSHGKPHLAADDGLFFSVSHSNDLALIALACGAEVGVDVELLNDSPDLPAVASHFFTPAELSHVTSGPPESLLTRFYQCWTRKEAWMKALGHGLLEPLDQFDVSSTLDSPVSTVSLQHRDFTSSWLMIEIAPTHTSIAALVTPPSIKTLYLFSTR